MDKLLNCFQYQKMVDDYCDIRNPNFDRDFYEKISNELKMKKSEVITKDFTESDFNKAYLNYLKNLEKENMRIL